MSYDWTTRWGGHTSVAVQCYQLRLSRMTYPEIAFRLGIDALTARNCAHAVAIYKGVRLDGPRTYVFPINR